jgi:hypothetical protein
LAQRTTQELKHLKTIAVTQKEVADVKSGLLDGQEQLEIAHLDLKTKVWELEQEILKLKEQAKAQQHASADPLSIKRS